MEGNTADARSPAQDIPLRTEDHQSSSSPVEMNSLQAGATFGTALAQEDTHQSFDSAQMPHRPMRTDTTTALQHARNPEGSPTPPLPSPQSAPFDHTHSTAIGEQFESVSEPLKDVEAIESGPKLMITLLLLTGARHPFHLDAKYLAKRNVQVQDNDPFNLSVYKVKELILREWRDEWEAKPSSPSAIRLISFGKVLDDKAAIRDLKFNPKTANVIHMSIKPQDFMDEEDAKGSKVARTQSHDGTERRSPGCRCVVM